MALLVILTGNASDLALSSLPGECRDDIRCLRPGVTTAGFRVLTSVVGMTVIVPKPWERIQIMHAPPRPAGRRYNPPILLSNKSETNFVFKTVYYG